MDENRSINVKSKKGVGNNRKITKGQGILNKEQKDGYASGNKAQNTNSRLGRCWVTPAYTLPDSLHLLTILSLSGMNRLLGKTIMPGYTSCILRYLSLSNQQ